MESPVFVNYTDLLGISFPGMNPIPIKVRKGAKVIKTCCLLKNFADFCSKFCCLLLLASVLRAAREWGICGRTQRLALRLSGPWSMVG